MRAPISAIALVISSLLAGPIAAAATIPPHIEKAIQRLEHSTIEGWHCVRTTERDGKFHLERHDPRRPQESRWTLVSIDHRTPTKKELQEHAKRQTRQRGLKKPDASPGEMLDPASLRLLRTEGSLETWSFRLRDPKSESRVLPQLQGTFVVDRADPAILSVSVRNSDTITPKFGVRLDDLNITLEFQRIGTELVPSVVNTRINGRVLGLNLVDHDSRVRYSQFRAEER